MFRFNSGCYLFAPTPFSVSDPMDRQIIANNTFQLMVKHTENTFGTCLLQFLVCITAKQRFTGKHANIFYKESQQQQQKS